MTNVDRRRRRQGANDVPDTNQRSDMTPEQIISELRFAADTGGVDPGMLREAANLITTLTNQRSDGMTVTCRGCDARVSDTTSRALAADLTTHDQECPTHGWRAFHNLGVWRRNHLATMREQAMVPEVRASEGERK